MAKRWKIIGLQTNPWSLDQAEKHKVDMLLYALARKQATAGDLFDRKRIADFFDADR